MGLEAEGPEFRTGKILAQCGGLDKEVVQSMALKCRGAVNYYGLLVWSCN